MDPIVTDNVEQAYLQRLDEAASVLPSDQRVELVENITDHIARARSTGEVADEAGLRTLLDRLGTPEEIVAAAREDAPALSAPPAAAVPPYPPPIPRRPGIGLEIAAVLLMTVGSIVPVLLWLTGVVLLWSSRRWRTGEKLLATLVVPGGPFFVVLAGGYVAARPSCGTMMEVPAAPGGASPLGHCTESTGPSGLWIALLALLVTAPLVIGVVLLRRARARADQETTRSTAAAR